MVVAVCARARVRVLYTGRHRLVGFKRSLEVRGKVAGKGARVGLGVVLVVGGYGLWLAGKRMLLVRKT